MKQLIFRLLLAIGISCSTGFLYAAGLDVENLVPDEDFDLIAPTIMHEVSEVESFRGSEVTIAATVTDDSEVAKVTLHYRLGMGSYKTLEMLGRQQDEYVAVIPAPEESLVEYFIEASDIAGNVTVKGLPETPLVLSLVLKPVAPVIKANETPDKVAEDVVEPEQGLEMSQAVDMTDFLKLDESTQETKAAAISSTKRPWYKQWWVWVIASGAIAAAVSAGGSGSGSSAATGPTGVVVITGPAP